MIHSRPSYSRLRAFLAAVVLASAPIFGFASPALAEDPVSIPPGTFVIDEAGVLGEDAEDLTEQIRDLQRDEGATLFVVIVDRFSNPSNSADWAARVANMKNMGTNDSILAIAVEDRQFVFDAADNGPYQSDEQTISSRYIQPKLAQLDYLGAAEAAVEGLKDAADGSVGAGSAGSRGGSGMGGVIVMGALVVAAVVFGFMFMNRRKRGPGQLPHRTEPQQPADPYDTIPIPELRTHVGSRLVQADDAIKTAEQEIGFAEASYGAGSVEVFKNDVAAAKEHMRACFQLQSQLDDHIPDTEQEQRSWLKEIMQRTDEVIRSLQQHESDFAQLRNLEAQAPQALAQLEGITTQLRDQSQRAERTLADLDGRYSAQALANAHDSLRQGADLITFVQEKTQAARHNLDNGDQGQAAWQIHEAENASQQLKEIYTSIESLPQDLQRAAELLDAELAEATQHISEAQEYMQRTQVDPALPGRVSALEAKVNQIRQSLPSDAPVQELAELEELDHQVDQALSPLRDEHQRMQQASRELDGAIARAETYIQNANDFIRHRRGAVAHQARAKLEQAERALTAAVRLRTENPVNALDHAKNASILASQAQSIAENDYDNFHGGYGPRGGRRDSDMSAVIGGLILGQLLGGGGRSSGSSGGFFGSGGSGGSFGGGGFSGGFGGGGGSFGGGGSGGSF
ncbi:TPM domain-containing protein [Micrococcoides hystricis]|uniref:TPM domain-containing protein n=1 Tax=Micrococcoides hystricis TaxID=1572761 RepID=A0ABV6P898_9MICC